MSPTRPLMLVMSHGHWSHYYPGTGWTSRYRHCRICNKVWRNPGEKPLLHKGRKP